MPTKCIFKDLYLQVITTLFGPANSSFGMTQTIEGLAGGPWYDNKKVLKGAFLRLKISWYSFDNAYWVALYILDVREDHHHRKGKDDCGKRKGRSESYLKRMFKQSSKDRVPQPPPGPPERFVEPSVYGSGEDMYYMRHDLIKIMMLEKKTGSFWYTQKLNAVQSNHSKCNNFPGTNLVPDLMNPKIGICSCTSQRGQQLHKEHKECVAVFIEFVGVAICSSMGATGYF